jgi:hemerythrin
MAPLEWKDEYSVGVPAVDHEHRELIELVNRLHQGLASQMPEDQVAVIFGDLFHAISAHFALEERFMRERGYDQATQHKADHERLLDELRDIMDDHQHGEGCIERGGEEEDAQTSAERGLHSAKRVHVVAFSDSRRDAP